MEPLRGRRSLLISSQRLLTSAKFDDQTQSTHFDYFRERVLPQTNAYIESGFWDTLVPQLSLTEPAVKFALVALSSAHQHWYLNGSDSYDADRNAVHHYHKAIGHANSLLEKAQFLGPTNFDEMVPILVTCILFICYEQTVGNYPAAAMHLRNGVQILSKLIPNFDSGRSGEKALLVSPLQQDLVDVLERIDFMSSTFGEAVSPKHLLEAFLAGSRRVAPTRFENVEEAQRYLYFLSAWGLSIGAMDDVGDIGPQVDLEMDVAALHPLVQFEKQRCLAEFDLWPKLAEEMYERNNVDPGPRHNYMSMQYLVMKIMLYGGFEKNDCAFDQLTPQFQELMDRIKLLDHDQERFSLMMGTVAPLWIVATRCRDPAIRREAIAMLCANKKRREGVWEGRTAGLVAEKMMVLEEQGIPNIQRPEDIPESARILNIYTEVSLTLRKVDLLI